MRTNFRQKVTKLTIKGTPVYIIKIRIIGAASLVLISLGIVLSVFHFNNEDIIGFRDLIRQNKTVPGKVLAEPRLPILHRQIADQRLLLSERNCTVVAEVPSRCRADFRKLVQLNFRLSSIRRKPDLTDMPKVNPLNLNYFMSATIVMSFGLVFGIISLTWLK